jgi:hypothetical protein
MLQMRRSRGAFSGFLLVLLGLWGALIPFVGPYFHFAYTPDTAWIYNSPRLWLEILPGAAVFLGGFFLLIATGRHVALFGAMLAAAAGAWFVLGTVLSPLWSTGSMSPGTPVGSTVLIRVMEQIGFFSGLGVVVVLVAAAAAGRIASVPAGIVPAGAHARTEPAVPAAEALPVRTRRTADTADTEETEETEVVR